MEHRLLWQLFKKSIHHSKYVDTIKYSKLKIENSESLFVHIDGEPEVVKTDIQVSIKPLSLNVIV